MAAKSPPPGHQAPTRVDLNSHAAVAKWITSFGVKDMVDRKYAEMLVLEGYEDLYSLDFTAEQLMAMQDGSGDAVSRGRANRMVRAAQDVLHELGVFRRVGGSQTAMLPSAADGAGSTGAGGVLVTGVEAGATVGAKDRGAVPDYPTGEEVRLTGVGKRDAMSLWAAELVVSVSGWNEELAN